MDIDPDYGYPRYSSRALAEILRLAAAVQAEARREAPAASAVLVITNAADVSVTNARADEVAARWR